MLNIVNSHTLQISTEKCLSKIKEYRKSGKVIVICPDRMALSIEQQIFDILKVPSLFDVDVYTMSRLCEKVVNNAGKSKKILSKQLAVTLIKKILIESKLDSFKDVVEYNGFALKLFEMISMFKSSKIDPKQLLEKCENNILREKLSDFDIVYTKYEEFLQNEYTDSFNRLDLFVDTVTNEFEDTHILFVGFDDFTKQMYNIINMFISKSKSVTIATASSYGLKEINNKNIFVNNIFYSLVELCKSKGYIYHIDVIDQKDDIINTYIRNNLYGYQVSSYNDKVDNIKLINFNDESTEIDFVLKDIKYKIINNNLRYGQFAIVIPELKSKEIEIKSKFEEYGVPYFMDTSSTLMDSNLSRYIYGIYQTIISKYKIDEFLNIIKDRYSNIDICEISQFENFANMSGINYVKLSHLDNFPNIKLLYENISILDAVDDEEFSDKISHMFELFTNIKLEDITNQIIKYYTDNGDIVLAKNYKLAYDKFFKAIEELTNLLTNYRLNINSFVDILKVYLENVSITIPPIIDDTVMVYDINNSFIDKNDYMYILSCVEGMVPKVISDVSLISDKEINFFDEDLRLNPTCELVNKRSKFKLYEHMFKYNNNLYISYHKSSFGGKVLPSSLITSLTKVLPQVSLIDGDKYITDYGTFTDRSTKSKFLLNNISNNTAITNLINMTKNYKTNEVNDYFKKYYFSLMKALPNQNVVSTILSNYSFDNTVSGLTTNNLYFAKGTSVSEIETYYNCPYKHFIRYGLRVAENKTGTLMASDIGNILHEFGSVVITKQGVKSKDVKDIAHSVLKNILEEKYSVYLANNSNKYIIKNLYDESVRIAKAIFDQQSNSKFKNKYNEKYFSKILELSHTHNGTTVYVKGFIDRIDVCEDKFALIDYKTGADKFSYRDLVSGKKLQLFVYVKAVEKMTDMIPVCTCYLPIRNDFSKSKEDNSYKLNGVFSNSVSDLSNLDKNYLDKKLSNINLTFKKDGTLDKRSSTYAISSENISKLADFALDMVNMAISNIIDGDISIYPLYDTDSACNRCSYKGICNFSTLYKNKYRFVDKVANCDEILDKGENE